MEKKSFNLRRKPLDKRFIVSAHPTLDEKITKATSKPKAESKPAKETNTSKKTTTKEEVKDENI